MRRLVIAAFLATSAPALAGPVEDFRKLQEDYWATYLRDAPTFASLNGVNTYARELEKVGKAEVDRQVGEAKAMLARLDDIPLASLPASEQANYAILRSQLVNFIDGAGFGSNYIPYSSGGTYADGVAQYLGFVPLKTATDYDNGLARLAKVAPNIRALNAIAVDSAKRGYARPCSTLGPLDKSTATVIAADPAKSPFFEPYAKAPAATQERAKAIIANDINPAIAAFNAAYKSDLRPRCLKSDGISALPDGKANYAYLVRLHTTTDMTPDAIHSLGLSEVARIRAEM